MSWWKILLSGMLNGAAQGYSGSLQSGADLKTSGLAAGAGAVAGLLQGILSHPAAAAPVVQAAAFPKPLANVAA